MRLLLPAAEVTSWLSNLLKASLVKEEETRVIDYNGMIAAKLEVIRKTLLKDDGESSGEFVEGLSVPEIELEPQPDPQEELEKARAEAEELLQKARLQAEQIKSQAQAESDQIRAQAQESGRQEGYEEGSRQAQMELEEYKVQLAEEEKRREKEYNERLKQLEPELVDVILKVVSGVTFTAVTEKRDIVLHLVENALEHIESSKQFFVHVSKEDYQAVAEQKEILLAQIPQSAELEIIKDVTLSQGQCMIETDGGIFDCSLDTQLNGLIADIKALSMQ